jgi:hypothetical protein
MHVFRRSGSYLQAVILVASLQLRMCHMRRYDGWSLWHLLVDVGYVVSGSTWH